MSNLFSNKNIFYISIVFFIFLLDRFTKIYILNYVEENGAIDIYVNQFLNFILVWNSGIGFGLLSFEGSLFYHIITLLIILINILII